MEYLWLDLELREDIDDYLTLIYALEQGFSVEVVSIHNPSIQELKLLGETFTLFHVRPDIVISGEVTEYQQGKDIHSYLEMRVCNLPVPEYHHVRSYFVNNTIKAQIFFCGGSLRTLCEVIEINPSREWRAFIQGGYAGASVAGDENTLKKFRKREAVPTWNLNLDIKASDAVIAAPSVSIKFISKNICHDSWFHKDDINAEDNVFNNALREYFGQSKYPSKCLHDLLAFMAITSPEIITFLPVDLEHTDDERPKWHSVLNERSRHAISIAFDKQRYIDSLKDYKIKD